MRVLEFEVLSGGTVRIDLEKCAGCRSKACVRVCNLPHMGGVLGLRDEVPALKSTPEEVRRGACTECLSCELICQLEGEGAITIVLPLPELEEYLKKAPFKPIYER